MTKKRFLVGLLAIVLIFGMTVVGCDQFDQNQNSSENSSGCGDCKSKWVNGTGGYAGCGDTSCSVYIAAQNELSSSSCNCD